MRKLVILLCAFLVSASKLDTSKRRNGIQSRIVGGRQTAIEEFPYQVSIIHDRAHTCGGAIYSPYIIITAAHCLIDVNIDDLAIVAGTTDWEHGGVERSVKKVVLHPKYNPKTFDNDIALIRLAEKLPFGPNIKPIQLPQYRQEFKPGSAGVVSGWGALGENNDDPDELHFTTLKIISYQDCVKAYGDINPVTKNMMCAWIKSGGYGTCQGDSGSALVVGNVLAGIVSWGLGCARPNIPEVYTKVSTYRRWLDLHIKAIR